MKKIIKYLIIIIFIIIFIYIYILSNNLIKYKQKTIKIGATSFPHVEILKMAKPLIEENGYKLKIKEFSDYTLINRALHEKSIDANFFQHESFLNVDMKNHNYKLKKIGQIIIEPMGIYSNKIKNLNEIKSNDIIAIPNDQSNLSRALFLLKRYNLINFKNNILFPTLKNISDNYKNIKFIEIDAALLTNIIKDPKITAGIINTNFALVSNLNPLKDNIGIENKNSKYANILVVRSEDLNKEFAKILLKSLTSKEIKKYIENNLSEKGILCAF